MKPQTTKYSKTQMIDYIYHNFTKDGKKIPKSHLQSLSIEKLAQIIERNNCSEQLRAWVNRPKQIKFMVNGEKDGESCSYDCEYPSEEECRKAFENEGISVIKILPKKGNHRCKYCKDATLGTDKDLLCEDCRALFNHIYYSEL